MSAQSTFSQTPAYAAGARALGAKELAAEEAAAYEELKRTLALVESVVKTNAKEKLPRVLRSTSKLRKTLSLAQLELAVAQVLPDHSESKRALLALLARVAPNVRAAATRDEDVAMEDAGEPAPAPEAEAETAAPVVVAPAPASDLIEIEVFLFLFALAALVKYKMGAEALDTAEKLVARCQQFNRRTLDAFQAKVYTYYASIHEQFAGDLPAIRNTLLAAHRTACLRYDEVGQATLVNLILRNYLAENLYEQAYKFVNKTTFPENVSNNQFVRYLYYVGKIQAVQLEYTEAFTKLSQSIRKAPQNTAFGFRRTVHKLSIIVQLLMGEVPERNVFNQDELRTALAPYLQLTNVRPR